MGRATRGEEAAIAKELKEKGYQLKHLLKALGLPGSAHCFEPSRKDAVSPRNKGLSNEIKSIFESSKGRYGVRRIHRELVNRGFKANRRRVQRLMHDMGLQGKRPKRKCHSHVGTVGKIADDLINRDFKTDSPFQKWTTDVSQFSFSWVKCCLSPILDMNTNEIISYDLSLHPNMEQIKRMLDQALERSNDLSGLIFHSDQGWQCQQKYYRDRLKENGIIQSMSRKGNCHGSCIMETFLGRMKNEMHCGQEKDHGSFESFSKAVDEYMYYYNNKRIQSKTKWMPPIVYRETSMCLD